MNANDIDQAIVEAAVKFVIKYADILTDQTESGDLKRAVHAKLDAEEIDTENPDYNSIASALRDAGFNVARHQVNLIASGMRDKGLLKDIE